MNEEVLDDSTELEEQPSIDRFEANVKLKELFLNFYKETWKPVRKHVTESVASLEGKEIKDEFELRQMYSDLTVWIEVTGRQNTTLQNLTTQLKSLIESRGDEAQIQAAVDEIVPRITSMRENVSVINAIKANLPRMKQACPNLYLNEPYFDPYDCQRTLGRIGELMGSQLQMRYEETDEIQKTIADTEVMPKERTEKLEQSVAGLLYESFADTTRGKRQEDETRLEKRPHDDYLRKTIESLSENKLAAVKEIMAGYFTGWKESDTREKLLSIGGQELANHAQNFMRSSKEDIDKILAFFENFDDFQRIIDLVEKSEDVYAEYQRFIPLTREFTPGEYTKNISTITDRFTETDFRLFRILVGNPAIEKLFGAEKTAKARAFIESTLIQKLTVINDHSDDSINLGYKLTSFTSPEAIKMNTFNAFRESGYSGERPLMNTLPDYLGSLSEEEMAKLRQTMPTELTELIDYIRENPRSLTSLSYGELQSDAEAKQKYREAMSRLRNAAIYYSQNGSEEERFFVMSVIQDYPNVDENDNYDTEKAGSDYLSVAKHLLGTTENPQIIQSIVEDFGKYLYDGSGNASEAAMILLTNYEKLGKAKYKTNETVDDLYLKGLLDSSVYELFADIHGVTAEQVSACSEMLKYIQSLREKGEFYYSFYADKSQLKSLLEVASKPGFQALFAEILEDAEDYGDADVKKEFAFYLAARPDLFTEEGDADYVKTVMKSLSRNDFYDFIDIYRENLESGEVSVENREEFFEMFTSFKENLTNLSVVRINDLRETEASELGQAVRALFSDKRQANQIMLDISCYQQFDNPIKRKILEREVSNFSDVESFKFIAEALRWLPEGQLSEDDTLETLQEKLDASLDGFKTGFTAFAEETAKMDRVSPDYQHVRKMYDDIVEDLKLKPKTFKMPVEFLREFAHIKRANPEAVPLVEVAKYIAKKIIEKGSAYTTGDIFYEQLGSLQDKVGGRQRRKANFTPEELFDAMESNVEASVATWRAAVIYQKEKPESPIFLIANERTGPADVAAEYLPEAFAKEHKILQNIKSEEIRAFVRTNLDIIEEAYQEYCETGEINSELTVGAREAIGYTEETIIPIYGTKIPSSLNSAAEEPNGIEEYVTFLKLVTLLGGRSLMMDESTRSAPRSIECLYNVLNRRQEQLGGVRLRLFGKIKGAKGRNGTELAEIIPSASKMEVACIDPWSASEKPINDDSANFVPVISGTAGFVEVIKPSSAAISRVDGISTLQDLWKTMIAMKVSDRFEEQIL